MAFSTTNLIRWCFSFSKHCFWRWRIQLLSPISTSDSNILTNYLPKCNIIFCILEITILFQIVYFNSLLHFSIKTEPNQISFDYKYLSLLHPLVKLKLARFKKIMVYQTFILFIELQTMIYLIWVLIWNWFLFSS